jgi:hypothetical protein
VTPELPSRLACVTLFFFFLDVYIKIFISFLRVFVTDFVVVLEVDIDLTKHRLRGDMHDKCGV